MSGDVQVRFCERLGVRFPRATHPVEESLEEELDQDYEALDETAEEWTEDEIVEPLS
jgi:hypothetical protein